MSIYTEILWYQVNLQRFFIDAPSVSMYRDFMVPRVGQFMQIVWGPESTLFLGSLIDPGNEVGPEYILSCPEYVNSVTEILWCSEYVANVQRFYGAHNRSNYRGFAEILWCLECVNSQRFYDALFSMISIGLKRQLDEPRPSKSAFLAISLSPSLALRAKESSCTGPYLAFILPSETYSVLCFYRVTLALRPGSPRFNSTSE